jgi:hypothetical protein
MKKHRNETPEQFELRRKEGHKIAKANKRPSRKKVDRLPVNRVSPINTDKLWRYFFTRTKVMKENKYVYQYTAKPKYQDIVSRARFLSAHGRYPQDVRV